MSLSRGDKPGGAYYLSDVTGYKLYYTGSPCGPKTGICPLDLADGQYLWKVSAGAVWDFCGQSGSGDNPYQFSFVIQDGSCAVVASEEEELGAKLPVTITGTLQLTGVDGIGFREEESAVIQGALAMELNDARICTDQLSAQDVYLSTITSSRLLLTANSNGILFLQFEINAQSLRKLIPEDLHAYISKSMKAGLFVSRVSSDAKSKGVNTLLSVTHATVSDLAIVHHISTNENMSVVSSIVVACFAFVGIALLILLSVTLLRKKKEVGLRNKYAIADSSSDVF